MVFLNLLFAFFRIGLFSFGGGLAMIPMYLTEVEKHGWMTQSEFMDIVALSQMTPGPIAVNMASYVGSEAAGWPGAIVATAALALPSVLVILALTSVLSKIRNNPWKDAFFFGIKSAAMALIFYAGWVITVKYCCSIHSGRSCDHYPVWRCHHDRRVTAQSVSPNTGTCPAHCRIRRIGGSVVMILD